MFEKLLQHDDDDSFVFRLSYNKLKYRVYIYGDYSYMVILPTKLTAPHFHNHAILLETVENFVESFLDFCRDVARDCIYNCEQEIGHYLLITFGVHIFDWNIWYAFFSRPYNPLRVLGSYDANGDEIWNFFPHLKLVN